MEEQQRQHLAGAIRTRRTYKGWTEATLSQESGVSIETISRLENAKTENPRDHTIASLAAAFKITSEELAGPRLSPEELDQATQTQLDRIETKLAHLGDILAELEIAVASLSKDKPETDTLTAGGEPPG